MSLHEGVHGHRDGLKQGPGPDSQDTNPRTKKVTDDLKFIENQSLDTYFLSF